jgi:tetratricopeptide (TPR) repeat protein
MRRIAVKTKNEEVTSTKHGSNVSSVVEDAAYPRYIVADDEPTPEPTLSAAFHDRNLSHLIGRRTGEGVWPDDPEDKEAVRLFEQGQKALYKDKDTVTAIRAYESALERDDSYIKAWVALAIAYISDNTPQSLKQAEDILENLASLPVSDWLGGELSSIFYQNLAYLHVHYYRQGRGRAHLAEADRLYAVADERNSKERLELFCPWAFVKMELGSVESARNLWERAEVYAAVHETPHLLKEYAAKYAPLRTFLKL